MALPPSGPISLSQVNVELGRPATQVISLGSPEVRALAQVPSGPISMSNLYGKSSVTQLTISSNQTCLDLRQWAIDNGWDQAAKLEVTIPAGIIVSSNNPAIAGLRINGVFPQGITLYNQGLIAGRGGQGGAGGWGQKQDGSQIGKPGNAGFDGLSISTSVNIDNASGTIAGGGGGGGGGNGSYAFKIAVRGSGGGGGGGGQSSNTNVGPGGAGGPVVDGSYGGAGQPGGNGTSASAGGGGSSPGGDGGPGTPGGAGGAWGASGAAGGSGAAGAAGGPAVRTNGAFINWINLGTIKGAIV